ncbi:MAG: cell wall hydrolase, partial [Paracoccus sp. (in: a-proteobacteria)]|nr:cell wall hydrolase [Paracoccus sp. (in: a-proteobacteria)]
MTKPSRMTLRAAFALSALTILTACGGFRRHSPQECMERAMYFESNRSSRDGMIAVGTVVMNRVASGEYPGSVCGVVGQKGQFAQVNYAATKAG